MSLNDPLKDLVGRRIVGVVALQATQLGTQPHRQVNLVLDDGRYFEFYGETT